MVAFLSQHPFIAGLIILVLIIVLFTLLRITGAWEAFFDDLFR